MKRYVCVFIAVLIIASALTGCGARKSASDNSTQSKPSADAAKGYSASYGGDKSAGKPETANSQSKADTANGIAAIKGAGISSQPVSNIILTQRKVIRNANISVEVEDFDKAYGQIGTIITGFGFIQESNIKKDKIFVNSNEAYVTRGVIVIRVAAEKFDAVLKDVKGLGLLTDEGIKSDDITDKFFDTEARLRVLKIEQERLEDYLKKLNDLDSIFKTESRLTQIRQEVESLTGTLRKWSDLVELSTITININEKRPGTDQNAPKTKNYFERLSEGFTGSFKGVVGFCGELILFLAQAIPVIFLLGLFAVVFIAVYVKLIRKHSRTDPLKGRNEEKEL